MNKQLKRVSTLVLLMFISLFCSTTVIGVFQVDNLRADARNVRTLYDSYLAERGPILVAGQPIAQSAPSKDQYKFQRTYTNGPLYSAVTGYFTLNQGTTGIENSLNAKLSGTANDQFLAQVNALITGQNPKGAAVELTIDPKIQQAAWDALGNQIGAIVAIQPSTGAILAMVSKPTFDPNLLASHDSKAVIAAYNKLNTDPARPLINRAIAGDLYHPGSVFKLVVASAALDGGAYTADSTFPAPDTLQLPLTTTVISNSEGRSCGGGATATVATAIRLSCNIPFAELGMALGEKPISDMAKKYGFGDRITIPMAATPSVYPTGMDLPHLAMSSFGQFNDQVTPLQIAMVSAAIANGGTLMQPTLIKNVVAPDLTVLQPFKPSVYSTPISQQTSATLTQIMVSGVSNGVASNARISGVDVAGKTGTAQNGTGKPFTLWFTGFAPAVNPQVAIAVVLENGGGQDQSAFGNTLAAPIAKKVLEAVLNK
jgi:peptidoglycan glycosyltransferase